VTYSTRRWKQFLKRDGVAASRPELQRINQPWPKSTLDGQTGSGLRRQNHSSHRASRPSSPTAYRDAAVYQLKPREQAFHGVQALRMIPVGDNNAIGRAGLLAHSYMLGPNGDSNGCVSIKDYDTFLKAFQNGEIKRLVVVATLNDSRSLLRQAALKS
jgi:hypothetical protein